MRRLIALGSLTGAPGVTTTACALAAAWPQADAGVRPVVVEANVWGGDLAVRCGVPYAPGLVDVAATARQSRPGSLLGAVAELPFGVRAVVAPAGRAACREAVRILAGEGGRRVLAGGPGDRGTVLLDLGRVGGDVDGLLGVADEVLLVTRGGPEALTHVFAYCQSAGDSLRQLVLVVVGPCPYPVREITETLGIERVVVLPRDVKTAAAMMSRRKTVLRVTGFKASPLMAAARLLACAITETDDRAPVPDDAAPAEGPHTAVPQAPHVPQAPEERSWA